MADAISTYNTILESGTSAEALTELCIIKDFPDMGGAPESIEITTLKDSVQKFIKGIKSSGAKEFTANYTSATYDAIEARIATDTFYAVKFGTAGADGIFSWQGTHSVYVVGAGNNAAVDMKIVIIPSTDIVKS